MTVKMFQPRFADLVAAGEKKQTVRPVPKRTLKIGDIISCRAWKKKPYRSKQRRLYSGTITEVLPVTITKTSVELDGSNVEICSLSGQPQHIMTRRSLKRCYPYSQFLPITPPTKGL